MFCCSEPFKALDCFLEASHGVETESFLTRLLDAEPQSDVNKSVLYLVKVSARPMADLSQFTSILR